MMFARFILWDMSGAVKSEDQKSTRYHECQPNEAGLLRRILNLGSGADMPPDAVLK